MGSDDARGMARDFDVIVIGAGFAGLYMLHRLRGLGLSARVLEAGDGVGGTWYWNRYPGARCDVESLQYSYSFDEDLERDWRWTERYARQPDILAYLNHVADRFDLRRDIQLDTRVTALTWDEEAALWRAATNNGETFAARFVVAATGCLSAPKRPDIAGLDGFTGEVLYTSSWPKQGADLTGKRVCLIGTGSSAIQAIPQIAAAAAAQLTVFQRTPNFSIPAHNGPLSEEARADWTANRAANRHQARAETISGVLYPFNQQSALEVDEDTRRATYEARWAVGGAGFMQSFADLSISEEANHTAAEFVRDRIRATVKNPETARRLLPHDHPIGTKRICVDTDYYETFNRDNVRLVSLAEAGELTVTAAGVRTGGEDYPCDTLVMATGFDAISGPLLAIDIRGRDGRALRDKWRDGPREYLGLIGAGFPNLLTVTGPGSPSVLSNMVVSIEQHVEFIAGLLGHMTDAGLATVDADPAAEEAWVDHVAELAGYTLYPKAKSWYMGANVDGKPRGFLPYIGGVNTYRKQCDEIAADGYRGFVFTPDPQAAASPTGVRATA